MGVKKRGKKKSVLFSYQESENQITVAQQSFSVQGGDPIYHEVDYCY